MLSSITLAFAFLLVATLLTVSVNQKLGQVAALRALGLPRRRIAAMLLWESALLVGVGGVGSVPLGWALAAILDRILRDMPGIPERVHFFVFEPRTAAAASRAAGGDRRGRGGLSGVDRDASADRRDPSPRDRLVTPIVEGRGLTRTFPMPSGPVTALREVSIEISNGEYVAITGPSGCGKSTLLHLLGCVDAPTQRIAAVRRARRGPATESERSRIRLARIGFVFQRFFLLPMLDALGERRAAAGGNRRRPGRAAGAHARAARVRRPQRSRAPSAVALSGGEMQRVAIARALANRPALLLADEPTGAVSACPRPPLPPQREPTSACGSSTLSSASTVGSGRTIELQIRSAPADAFRWTR